MSESDSDKYHMQIDDVFVGGMSSCIEWFTIKLNPDGSKTVTRSQYDDTYEPVLPKITIANWSDIPSFTATPPKVGEVMGRNKFDDNGNVIGYETWIHGENNE